ncbi:MAG TPA: ATP-binding cassette domain-containing protein [Mycobacteriales bacterium]|nr:ATP-binding cassette domain-containing protein [Mycobacteriales bacterium]
MIDFDRVTVTYDGAPAPALTDVTLHVPEGELCLVIGRTGSGKSTLLGAVNGLVPHFTGGRLAGRVTVAGRDTRDHPPRELADVVGFVGQDPAAGFVTDVVTDELAYTMESIGLPPDVMRRRIEDTLDLLGLADLRDRPLATLSGGQQQRVAIGSVLTAHPRVLVLDEPTSALDPPAAEEVLAALQRLVHDLGLTVLLAEHRLERVVQYADRIVHVPGAGRPVEVDSPARVMATAPIAPPVVELGRLAGWDPVPLSIRDARRLAGPLRAQLGGAVPARRGRPPGAGVAEVRGLVAGYGSTVALRGIDLVLRRREVVALMGRNGAGKSTLLGSLVGLLRPRAGTVTVDGLAPYRQPPREVVRRIGLVPQDPTDLLYAETVAAECAQADADAAEPGRTGGRGSAAEPGRTRDLLDRLAPGIDGRAHPRDLSEGQRLALALAIVLASTPPILLLDEPTRGLDYGAKARLAAVLADLADRGHAVLLATHDVELAADVADRTIVLADGEIVADGPTRDVVTQSPSFAPQVAKILAPDPWLTVTDVRSALNRG